MLSTGLFGRRWLSGGSALGGSLNGLDVHRHGLVEQLRVGHNDEAAVAGLQQRPPQLDVRHRASTNRVHRDPVADPDVALEQDVVARHVVLEHVLHAEAGHDRGEQDARDREVLALERKADREEEAKSDQDDGGDPAPDLHHVRVHVAPAQSFDQAVRDEASAGYKGQEDDQADADEYEVVVRDEEKHLQRRQAHSLVSAASSAPSSPSAAASPSAPTTASTAGASSSTFISRLCTILTISSSGSRRTVTPFGTVRSAMRNSDSISSRGVRSTSNSAGMSDGRHSTRRAWIGCSTSASPRLTAADSPTRWTGTSTVIFSSRLTW